MPPYDFRWRASEVVALRRDNIDLTTQGPRTCDWPKGVHPILARESRAPPKLLREALRPWR